MLKVFFWLVSVNLCCIIPILSIQRLPTVEDCAKNYTEFCKLRHCKHFYAKNSDHRKFIELSSPATANLLLDFYVIGSSDCHVHLSPVVNPAQTNDAVYDILIGGFNNSRTFIRHGKKLLLGHKTENVLSERKPVQIRIEKSQSFIHIYHSNELLLTAVIREPAPTRYFSFATDQLSGMSIYYDCPLYDSNETTEILSANILSVRSSVERITSQTDKIIYALVFRWFYLALFNGR